MQDAAKEILRRPEFQAPPKSLYQRLLDFVGHTLGRLIDVVAGGGRGALLAVMILAIVAAATLYLVARGLQLGRPVADGSDGAEVVVERRRRAIEWDAEAEAFEARGEWRAALRCRYRALVARLARAGVVDEVPGRTAGEYRRLVGRARPAVAPPFSDASDLFERAWYGGGETGPDDSAAFRRLADEVASGAGPS